MDFFGHQAKARARTRRLILLFALAVLGIVAAIDLVVLLVLGAAAAEPGGDAAAGLVARNGPLLAGASLLTLAVIAAGSLFKTATLRGGGTGLLRSLGARPLPAKPRTLEERRLRNVVEEVAIASGVPVPEVYVLPDEPGINAFAAGWSTADAVIAVTRGALEHLDRDELQGVIAHEFSHVLNGDMRLNMRLIGVLFGILMLALAGRKLLRHGRFRGRGAAAAVAIAVGVMLVGYIGLFFGRLIKAAVSRQREYLADAAAVQFTRQTRGLGGALKKIAALEAGSRLAAADTEQVSHMLFSEGMGFSGLFATHPPLPERITRLEGRFEAGEILRLREALRVQSAAPPATAKPPAESPAAGLVLPAAMFAGLRPEHVAAHVGGPEARDFDIARDLRRSLPEELRERAHDKQEAPALLLALLLEPQPEARARQLQALAAALGADWRDRTARQLPALARLEDIQRLPLAVLCFPALRRRPQDFLRRFLTALQGLAAADGVLSLREYCLGRLLRAYLTDVLKPSRAARPGRRQLKSCLVEVRAVLALFAALGHADAAAAEAAYRAGMRFIAPRDAAPYRPPSTWRPVLERGLDVLDGLRPADKERLVEGLVAAASRDGRISLAEAELLRMVCGVLHCPLPPSLGLSS